MSEASAFVPAWLELSSRDGALCARHRCASESIAIGRGYQNDVILDDPHVSPAHARIERDAAGQWWIEDLGSDNGTRDLRDGAPIARAALYENAGFVLGKTVLRIRGAAFAVPPALPLPARGTDPHSAALAWRGPAFQAVAMIGAVVVLAALSVWLKQTGEPKFAQFVFGAIFIPLMALGWAGAWALITRIVTASSQYFRHVWIVAAAMLALAVLEMVVKYVDYAFALVWASKAESVATWLVLGALGIAHLSVIVPHRKRLAAAIVAALVFATIGIDAALRHDRDRLQPPTIVTSLLPAYLPTKPPVDRERLFNKIEQLKQELDDERKKDPPSGPGQGLDID